MQKLTTTTFMLVVLASAPALGQQWARKMFSESYHDFGSVARGAKAEFEFVFKNIYQEDVHVAAVRSSCGCTSVWIKDDKRLLKTYQTASIVARVNSATFLGRKGATITVTFDRPQPAQVQLQVRSYIHSDVVLNPGSVNFGSVPQGTAAEKTVSVTCPGRNDLRIVEVRSANPHLSAEVLAGSRARGQAAYQLQVRLDENAPAGYIKDHLLLVTNDPRRTQVPVLVEGRVVSSVSVSPNWLLMGVVQPGGRVSKRVVVRGTQPFRITRLTTTGDGFQFDTPAAQEPKRLHVVPVTFVAGNDPGKVVRTIRIETDLGGPPAELSAQAVVSGPEAAPAGNTEGKISQVSRHNQEQPKKGIGGRG